MNDIDRASDLLRRGGLVAFPTETVYGLGADATHSAAVRRIFTAKGRPATNPLIIHVADATTARRYATIWPESAERLAATFWPGPLTLVLPKASVIVPEATAGRDTVGLRVPNHPLALQLLRAFGGPVAAPSANRSNHISPTEAKHVRQELGDAVDLILDGGPCQVGIESTVLDLSVAHPTVLRPGHVTREQIESVIGPVELFSGSIQSHIAAASPGQQLRHYSPHTPAYHFELNERDAILAALAQSSERVAVMMQGRIESSSTSIVPIVAPTNPTGYARSLYGTLRLLDQNAYSAIWIELPPATPQWLAIRDRLIRATQPAEKLKFGI